jgi:hypothetical protein
VTANGHAFHLTKLFFTQKAKNLVNYPRTKTHLIAQLHQRYFPLQIQYLQSQIRQYTLSDARPAKLSGHH